MTVLDLERASWILFEEAGVLLLDVNCSHGAAGYTVLIPLTEVERSEYALRGREYLCDLALAVQERGPLSQLQQRNVSASYSSEAMMVALHDWLAAHPEEPLS